MSKQQLTWQLIYKNLRQQLPVMLLYVLESHGSSPGRQGFLMAVAATGELAGSIGGGIMEYKFVELAKEILGNQGAHALSIRSQYHDKTAARDQSGMICSGDQTILIYTVKLSDIPAVQAIIDCLQAHKNGLLELSPAGIQFFNDRIPAVDFQFSRESDEEWVYQEKIGYKNQLYIIGGGHCALALSELMSRMDFYIRVFDTRPELHTMVQNKAAHEKTTLQDFSELGSLIASGKQHYVVVMTMGYRTDDMAMRALLNKEFAYLGVLGSQAKMKKLLADYRAEGVYPEQLQLIHAPVGLAINSQTPEEIAVSIAGEIIRVKNIGSAT